jgi:hypothetical protein
MMGSQRSSWAVSPASLRSRHEYVSAIVITDGPNLGLAAVVLAIVITDSPNLGLAAVVLALVIRNVPSETCTRRIEVLHPAVPATLCAALGPQ